MKGLSLLQCAAAVWSYAKQKDLCDEHTEMSGNSYLANQLADLPPPSFQSIMGKFFFPNRSSGRPSGRYTPHKCQMAISYRFLL